MYIDVHRLCHRCHYQWSPCSDLLLLDFVNRETGVGMDEHVLTIGFARRATTYKRGDLLFQDIERLRRISNEIGKIQVIFGGKAHPRDHGGKELIKRNEGILERCSKSERSGRLVDRMVQEYVLNAYFSR